MARQPRLKIDPLNIKRPIVDPETGTPTSTFMRLWEQLFGNEDVTAAGLAAKADKVTEIIAGVGLVGGGDLSENRTLDLEDTAVTPGVYGDATNVAQITVDQQGRITSVVDVPITGGGGGGGAVDRRFWSQRAIIPAILAGAQQLIGFGSTDFTTLGSQSNSGGAGTTSYFLSKAYFGRQNTTSGANQPAALYTAEYFTRGSSGGAGGYEIVLRMGNASNSPPAGSRYLWGLANLTTLLGEPSATLDCVFVGADSTDTNLQVMHNDGAGVCTKVDLGANFPAKTGRADVYRVEFRCEPNATSIDYTVTRENTGDVATGTLTTDLPLNTTRHRIFLGANSGPVGNLTQVTCFGLYTCENPT